MESWTVRYFEENKDYCLEKLKDRKFWEQVPLLNHITECEPYNNKLIRFKGMIQDILNPIYYIEQFHVVNTKTSVTSVRSGKYRDRIDLSDDEKILQDTNDKIYQEKYIMRCVQVPGLNSWTKEFKFIDDLSDVSSREEKRKLEESSVTETNDDQSMEIETDERSKKSSQNNPAEANLAGNSAGSSSSVFSVPIVEEKKGEQSVILNLYDDEKSNSLHANEVIEVAGFLSLKSDIEGMDEDECSYFNSPIIHVIHVESGSSTFRHMLDLHKEYIFQNACSLRDELWIMLTDILLGDTLAADYLICHLISSVYLRQNHLALGKFSLNISDIPKTIGQCQNFEYVPALYRFLSHLLEKSVYLPITIDYLNNTTMIPKKNTEENRLVTGLLQVSSKTHFVIDETKLEPGTLGEKGVRNVEALRDIIDSQRIQYDFEYYQLPFVTDCPVLSLSSSKSLLPSDFHLILDPDPSCVGSAVNCFERAWKKMQDPLLSRLRFYLSHISTLNYELTDEMQKVIEKDFVQMRQDDQKTSSDDLHRLLVLSRFISLSRGHKSLQNDAWEYACRMEDQRKCRKSSL
ncbi:hypothetical protein V9T40_004013 [Parthenolecanium corni]|uniref:Mini-chromosome maintenance complex-binding protein n=1 Tax=Parthenolecanium corni TaxID=536013 RepID=A0AAN9TGQ9_9HEMI